MEYLFVYGTLLSSFRHPLSIKLQMQGRFLGKGFVFGKLYDMGNYPAAIPDKHSLIKGEIYEIPAILFFELDDYEDYNYYNPSTSLYVRKRTKAFLFSGNYPETNITDFEIRSNLEHFRKLFCWIYWFRRRDQLSLQKVIEEGDYLEYVRKAEKKN